MLIGWEHQTVQYVQYITKELSRKQKSRNNGGFRTMTLESVKLKIDNHFDSITAEDLYNKLTEEYGMQGYDLDDKETEMMANIPISAEIA